MERIGRGFFEQDTVAVAKNLLGKVLVVRNDSKEVRCLITETEAYCGARDKASHTYLSEEKHRDFDAEKIFNKFRSNVSEDLHDEFVKNFKKQKGKLTNRTLPMFLGGGHAYIYLCYGMYNLLNISTRKTGYPEAVLIRAGKVSGVPKNKTNGPGKLTKLLNIDRSFNSVYLANSENLWIEEGGLKDFNIVASPRIGIDYAEECKDLPWRFNLVM